MDIPDILVGVISALAATITALVGLLRFYLPRHSNRHNPHSAEELREVRQLLQDLHLRTVEHNTAAQERHRELVGLL